MTRILLLASASLLAAPALAQGAGHTGTPGSDTFHDQPTEDVIVTAPIRGSRQDVLSGATILSAAKLARELRPTIGETLARQPGVSSTAFGPNASRPILRGFQGERVRVLTDGIGSFDVSNTSVDHAVVINPLNAERIEILRGPAALLFGSSAIGGVVNVIDRRIPISIPDEDFHLSAIATYGSAAREGSGGAALDLPVSDRLVLHFDGSYMTSDDLAVGGALLTPALRAQAAASPDPAIQNLATLRDRLPNSAARTWDVAGGASIITDRGTLGFSIAHYESLYGVPIRYSLDPAVEPEAVRLDARQTRADVRAEVEVDGGFLDRIRFRAGYADYVHDELEDDGAVGTSFFAKGMEGRVELVQSARGAWKGAFGGQFVTRDLRVVGEEKFLPPSESQQYGLFTVQQFDFGGVKAEIGGRFERSIATATADADLGNDDIRRAFNTLSGSAGASVALAGPFRFGINLSRSARAPSAEELFANGPHAGTQAFERGNPGFDTEKSWGAEATLRGRGPGWSLEASAYHSWFDGYIYDSPTGATEDDLPVFQYLQADARYYGFEIEGSAKLATIGGFGIVADALADYVRARVIGSGPAPRIPPLRLLGGIEAQSPRLTARAEIERSFAQKRVTGFETTTPGYTMVNASFTWKPIAGNNSTALTVSANNIFDVVARRHASFLKDYAPLAGRDIRVSARISF